MNTSNLYQLQRRLAYDRGFTVRVIGNEVQRGTPDQGYAVSLGVGEEFEHLPTLEELYAFIVAFEDDLNEDQAYLGGWYDSETGHYWLDVVVVLRNRYLAHKVARATQQIAYWDFSTGHEVRV